MVCIRCQKRPAIIFVQRMENGQMKNEGYCLHCARELHIKPVDDLMKQFGMSEQDLDNMENRMESMMEELGDSNPLSMLMNMSGSGEDADAEKARYASAVAKFIEQTNAQIERMTQTVGEEAAAIMGAHIEFAEDDGIKEMVANSIDTGMCAEQAVSEAYKMYYDMFSASDEEVFRETVRYRTVGDMSCTGAVESTAGSVEQVLAEVAASTITERGATRADDRLTEAAMEDRKKDGYF